MSDDPTIRQLDERTVERIAAGEVVERPASVVKELVENSLDADAGRVAVTVADGRTGTIRISDDGVGMSEADVRRAVRKHTTSKIRDIEDLESGVATLGFRGEALYAIGAVSRTTITTRSRGGGTAGTELRIEGGEVTEVGPAGCPEGTTIEVADLFYNVPARRKYLKAESTEFAHVNRIVTRYALANPDVAVSLSHGDREVFATTGQGDLRATLLAVYGREVAESMIAVEGDDDALADTPLTGVRGFVSDPETTRSTREYLSTFVNGRYVSESALREAVLAAYGTQLAADRFPFAVLFFDLPGDGVDVNVHPRKLEVRFDDEEGVRAGVREAVEDALLDHGLVRTSAPRGRSAPGDAPVAPELTEQTALEGTEGGSVERGTSEAASDSPSGRQADRPSRPHRDWSGTDDEASADATGDRETGDRERPAGSARMATDADDTATLDVDWSRAHDWTDARDGREPGSGDRSESESAADAGRSPSAADIAPERKFRPATENERLGEEAPETTFDRLPPMRVLGQVHDTYVVAETPDGLVLVDQHAADERVNYERLVAAVADGPDTQQLVSTVELELTAQEAAAFDDALADLRSLGFDAWLADDDRTAVVEAVPAVFADALEPDLLRDVLAAFVGGEVDHGRTVESAADALLADMACYPSVTGNTSLREGRVVDLLAALDDCRNPYACPHGRPVVIQLSREEIADRFERDYPGHAVRRPEE